MIKIVAWWFGTCCFGRKTIQPIRLSSYFSHLGSFFSSKVQEFKSLHALFSSSSSSTSDSSSSGTDSSSSGTDSSSSGTDSFDSSDADSPARTKSTARLRTVQAAAVHRQIVLASSNRIRAARPTATKVSSAKKPRASKATVVSSLKKRLRSSKTRPFVPSSLKKKPKAATRHRSKAAGYE